MKILYVLPASSELPAPVQDMAEVGMHCNMMQPSFLSALTAMQIAREAEKCAAQIVRLCRIDDAMAAVSARKIAKWPFSIVMEAPPGAKPPRRIPRDLLAGVDAWIFPTPADVWPDAPAERVRVMPPCGLPLAELPLVQPADCASAPSPILWIGPIDGNYDRLGQAIDALAPGQQLRICGTGQARHTMPLVRRSRQANARLTQQLPATSIPERHEDHASAADPILWLGEEYNLASELAAARSIIQSGPSPTLLELRATARQTPLATASSLFADIATAGK